MNMPICSICNITGISCLGVSCVCGKSADKFKPVFNDDVQKEVIRLQELVFEIQKNLDPRNSNGTVGWMKNDLNAKCAQNEKYVDELMSIFSDLIARIENLEGQEKDTDQSFECFEKRIQILENKISDVGLKNEDVLKTEDLNFGEAIKAMQRGCKVGQWHRDDIYVYLKKEGGGVGDHFVVKTIDGIFYPWMPNQRELLSDTWRVIDD